VNEEQFPIDLLRPSIRNVIKRHRPDLEGKKSIPLSDLNKMRALYFEELLSDIEGEVENKKEIIESLTSNLFVTQNINEKIENIEHLGDRISSYIAGFFGSWLLILLIFGLVIFWILFNLYATRQPFDPFPFAVLGLLLTALSALQAPFILNSQKKQSERDRLKFNEDYQTNLKSELEIRNLHSKIDHYNMKIWERLEDMNKKK